jgi:nucleotide-binding universal stress UspA family protein
VAGDLVEDSGRPVVIVPDAPLTFSVDRVMVAWKDTPESRRAVLGALPLLRRATKITVVEIASAQVLSEARQELIDVSRWLAGHGVTVETLGVAALHDDAEQLESLAHDLGANLIVAGAYGHNRLREWAFGGITRILLQRGSCCTLLSH